MPKPQDSTEVGDAIKIPTISNRDVALVDDRELTSLQDKIFEKKDKSVEDDNGTTGTPSGKSRATEIFNKTQKVNKELKQESKQEKDQGKGKSDEDDFTGKFPEFDASQFLTDGVVNDEEPGEDEGNDEDPDVEVDTGSGVDDNTDFSKEENLKNLRKIAGNFKRERDEVKGQLEELRKSTLKQPNTAALENQLTTLRGRVKELEKYELVFGLQNNPQFKERFVDSAINIVSEIRQIVTDYGLDAEVTDQILLIDNRRDLDEALEEAFASSSARNDVKALKQKYDGIQRDRIEFEKKPREALEKFQSEQAQSEAEINQKRDNILKNVSTDGWSSALAAVAQTTKNNKIYELIEQPGKKEHNEKVVRPTLTAAESLYHTGVDYIEKLARNKAVMTSSFTQWFAQICQQAAATQMVNHVRWGIYDKYNALLEQQKQQGRYERPGIVTQGKTSASSPKKSKKLNGKEIAADIFENVVFDK